LRPAPRARCITWLAGASASTALACAALAPAAGAATLVQLDRTAFSGGQACVTAHTGGGPESDSHCTEELTFSQSASISLASANHVSAIVDAPEGITIDAEFDATATENETTAGTGGALLQRGFTVSGSVPYKIVGGATTNGQSGTRVTLTRECPGGGCDIVDDHFPAGEGASFSYSGTLPASSQRYRFELDTTCSSTPGTTCTAHSDVHVELGNPPPPVVIGSGPSGLVASRSAHFEFTTTDPTPPAGQLECRIDGQPDFSPCSSPVELSNLSDGQHTFRVRYHPDDADPSGVTSRSWTVDATAPAAIIDSAPSGSDNGSTAQIAFHSTEPEGAAFACSVDGGQEVDCSSPHSLAGLSDGPHSFSVRAFDLAGNASVPATAGWTVSPVQGSDSGCTGAGASTGFGPIRLVARAADACFFDDTVDGEAVKVSPGQVTLNGITLTPAAGTRIIVSSRLGDGTVRTDGPVTIVFGPPPKPGEASLGASVARLDLNGLATVASGANRVLGLAEGLAPEVLGELLGMEVAPGVGLEFSPDNGGQTKVTLRVTLPKVAFKRLPGSPEGVTVEFSPTFSNDRGVTVGGRIKLGQAYLFGEKVKDLDLAYDHGTGLFEGSAGIVLGRPRGGIDPVVSGTIGLGPTDSNCGLRRFALQASGQQRPIAPGLFLQRFGGTFECVPDGGDLTARLIANGGVSAGPRVAIGSFETEAVSIDGTATLSIPVTGLGQVSLAIQGAGKLIDFPVAQQTISYTAPATLVLSGGLDIAIGGYGAQLTYGQEGTFLSEGAFNVEAEGRANLFFVDVAAHAIFSSTGFAVCMGPRDHRVGFGKRWGGEVGPLRVCDVGPFRTALPARAAQVGGRSFTVGKGGPLTVIAAEGEGASPKVVVSGPGGARVATPPGPGGVSTKEAMLVQDSDANVTYVSLFSPAPGRWTVTTPDGSAPPARIRFARGLPPVKIAAHVRRRGARRLLTWRARGLAGQRLQLVERSRGGAHLLRSTRRKAGRLLFTPDPQLGRKRTIEAVVFNGATPRSSTTVARFTVPPPQRTRRVRKLKLRGRTLSWQRQRAADAYELALVRPDGTTSSRTVRRPRLKLAGHGAIRVQILAVDVLGRPGPLRKARFKLP
jgi:hypothetical protein